MVDVSASSHFPHQNGGLEHATTLAYQAIVRPQSTSEALPQGCGMEGSVVRGGRVGRGKSVEGKVKVVVDRGDVLPVVPPESLVDVVSGGGVGTVATVVVTGTVVVVPVGVVGAGLPPVAFTSCTGIAVLRAG